MKDLASFQAKYLRGLAHAFKPVVYIGQQGLTEAVIKSAGEAFRRHELIKVRFVDFKEKAQKLEIAADLAKKTDSRMAGMIGHIAIFYKPHSDPAKRKITLPQ
jgi:RNA-binding protein